MLFFRRLFGEALESDGFYLPPEVVKESVTPSPDATRLAYAVRDYRGQHVEVNGRAFADYRAVAGITFSPDSRHIAYAALHGYQWFAAFDEREYGPYDDIGKTSPVINPLSTGVAYTALLGRKWYVFVDGEMVGGPYEGFGAGGVVFSPDAQRIVYVVKRGDRWLAVVDGEEHKAFPTIMQKSQTFSFDSKKVVYVAGIKGAWIGHAFVGEDSVVVNGEIQQPWKHDDTATQKEGLSNEIFFSPDSRRMAYSVVQKGKFFFVIDGIPQKKYDGLVSGWKGNPQWAHFPDYGKASCRSGSFSFSPDSRHFAYAVADRRRNRHVLVYDGEESGTHQGIANEPIVFSPDSSRLAYTAAAGGGQFLVLDRTPLRAYYGTASIPPRFSPDSQHVAYIAMNSPSEYVLVIDTQSWRLQGAPPLGANLVWDNCSTVHVLVADGRKVTVERYPIGG
jgi:hypothetical protein